MAKYPMGELEPRQRRRLLAAGLLRALLTTTVLVVLYYILPFDEEKRLSAGLRLVVGLALFVAVAIWQIRAVLGSKYPGIRAISALAATVPLFLLMFAATYFLMSTEGSGNFSENLTRTDSLYLAVTIFATVGFGDITATSESARLVVTVQMILDLIILGLGINAFVSAAKVGRQRRSAADEVESASP